MCWMCDHPGSTIDDYLAEIRAKIRRRGWTVQYVEDDRVPYAYTIGLSRHGLPEFLMTGVSPQRALQVLGALPSLHRISRCRLPAIDSPLAAPWSKSCRSNTPMHI